MNFATPYAYRFENAQVVFQPAIADWSIVAAFLLLVVAAVMVGPYVYGYFVQLAREAEKAEKKRVIRNLLTMKEVQTELEDEMRHALMNANLS
jgi:hypothetical protein